MITTDQLRSIIAQPGYAVESEYPAFPDEVETIATTGTNAPRRHKYNAVATEVDGRRFASKAEAARYQDLCYMEMGGRISNLKCQPRYPLVVNGVNVGTYVADFRYVQDGREVVEDVKGVKTPIYRLKKKLVKALYGIEIKEVE